jgi:nucleoside-diphosphate-sugar epimerase
VLRSYGYVKNVVDQIFRATELPPEAIHGRVFYLGDEVINLLDWVNAFSRALTGREARVVPRVFVRGLALIGDAVVSAGGRFPIQSSRLRSMTENYITPMEPTFSVFGRPPISLQQGVTETVTWLRTQDGFQNLSPATASDRSPVL